MSLQSCPTCGYALSVLDHHCRHCAAPLKAFSISRSLDVKQLATMIAAALALSLLTYWIFFR